MAYAAVISLQKTMEDLAGSPHRISLSSPSLQLLKPAYNELESLRHFLKRLDESSKSNSREKVNALDARIKEAVWKFEDLLESHVYNQILPQSQILGLLDVHLQEPMGHDADSFTKMLEEKQKEYMYELDNMSPQEASDVSSTIDSGPNNFKMVGSSDVLLFRKIRRNLEIIPNFDVISVVGMGGIGKTTLVKEIFNHILDFKFNHRARETEFKLECRAWVTIGRNYQLDKLERDILIQLDPHIDRELIMEGGETIVSDYLIGILNTKRCLIVFDDVWDTDVWDRFRGPLKEYKHLFEGTLVLLTTRLQHVARHADPRRFAVIHKVGLLDQDQSWDLLRQRVFGEEEDSCPPQLIKAGKKIAERCDGLPLMIVTVADLLSQAEKTVEYWEKVAEDSNSSIFMDAYEQISEVLFPSYEYLPQHLKPCFLYMGVIPQRYEISKLKLLSMWIAEGFVDLSRDEETEEYLGELIDHSVVIKCQTSSRMKFKNVDDVKTCRLHSTFWYLCNREATESKFFHGLTICDDCSPEIIQGQRRLSIRNNILLGIKSVFDSIEDACASTARSLLCYGPYYPYAVPICCKLSLLKVLDALQIRFYEFPVEILQLLYLRYITLTYNGELPASISVFWNLEFLIIDRNMSIKYSGETLYVPIQIWDMERLKHIEIMGSNLKDPRNGASLKRLSTLKGVGAETCTQEVLERIPHLRKLGIQIELHPDDEMNAFHFLDHVHVLHEMRSLKCVVVNPVLRSPASLSQFQSNLTKLHLSGMGYPWEYMSIVGKLADLAVLKLRCYAFRGPKWEVMDGTIFRRLQYLLIEDTDLKKFEVGHGGFVFLSRLCLRHCYKLQDIQWRTTPSNSPVIEVLDCSSSAVTFANKMRSRYESYNRDPERVYVHSSWDDRKLK